MNINYIRWQTPTKSSYPHALILLFRAIIITQFVVLPSQLLISLCHIILICPGKRLTVLLRSLGKEKIKKWLKKLQLILNNKIYQFSSHPQSINWLFVNVLINRWNNFKRITVKYTLHTDTMTLTLLLSVVLTPKKGVNHNIQW